MTTLRTETIVESKGENVLERMVDRVLHHKPPAAQEPVAAEPQPESSDDETAAAAVATVLPGMD